MSLCLLYLPENLKKIIKLFCDNLSEMLLYARENAKEINKTFNHLHISDMFEIKSFILLVKPRTIFWGHPKLPRKHSLRRIP